MSTSAMSTSATKIKRSLFKTDDDYVCALSSRSSDLFLKAYEEKDVTARDALLNKSRSLKAKAIKYQTRKRNLAEQGMKSTSQANRLAVRAAERALAIKADKMIEPVGIEQVSGAKPLITFTFMADVVKAHGKYPISRTVVGMEYENPKNPLEPVVKYAVLKNDDDNVYWPNARRGYYTLPVERTMSLL